MRHPFVIFNPASGRGSGAKRLSTYLELLKTHFPDARHVATTRAGEEAELTLQALAEPGVDLIVAVGGDGTWSNVADTLLRSGRDDVAFGMLVAGTGNDFGRNFGLAHRPLDEAVAALETGEIRHVDVGRVTTPATKVVSGERVESRHFLNLIGFGFDVAVIEATENARFLKGELLYKVTAVRQLFRFDGFDVELESNGVPISGGHLMLTISNGPFFGGAFPIAPDAELTDGLLDACAIGDHTPFGRMKLFDLAGKGRHVTHGKVNTRQSPRFTVRFPSPPRFEIDGDLWESHTADVEVEVVPGALPVVVG